jgi:predicted nucleic acid-binding protein
MHGTVVDSNVLLRHFLQDDPEQSPKATAGLKRDLEQGHLYLSAVVMAETLWLLTRGHHIPPRVAASRLLTLLESDRVLSEDKPLLLLALNWMKDFNVPFTDAYLATLAQARQSEVLTFDQKDFKKLPIRWRVPR